MDEITKTLEERGLRYGSFDHNAATSQRLRRVLRAEVGWGKLNDSQREALEMISHKIGRILSGDPNYDDNWRDIAGYAMLVCNGLQTGN